MNEPQHMANLMASQVELAMAYLGRNQPDECVYIFRRLQPLFEKHQDAMPTGADYRDWITTYQTALRALKREQEADLLDDVIRSIGD